MIDEIREIATLYPESRSAARPPLRLAQERHRWLSRAALEEVADALDLPPA
jgi:NADH:ubiquinone oxidoreductase subunit E